MTSIAVKFVNRVLFGIPVYLRISHNSHGSSILSKMFSLWMWSQDFLNFRKSLEFSFSTISPSNHFWVFLFTLLVLYEANLSITVIIFCTESEYVHRHYQKFRSFGRLIVKGFFYNHKPIVFLWTEVYVLVNNHCFKFFFYKK